MSLKEAAWWQLDECAVQYDGLSRAQLLTMLKHERARFNCLWRKYGKMAGGDPVEAREYVDGVLRSEWE